MGEVFVVLVQRQTLSALKDQFLVVYQAANFFIAQMSHALFEQFALSIEQLPVKITLQDHLMNDGVGRIFARG